MKKIILILTVSILGQSCSPKKTIETNSNQDSSNVETTKDTSKTDNDSDELIIVDKIHIGMELDKMKELYKGCEFKNVPVYEYGVDGSEDGILVIKGTKPHFFVWNWEGQTTIAGITILSESITIDNGVHTGMTYAEFKQKKPDCKLAIDMIDDRIEFSYVPNLKYRIEFLTSDSTRVAKYDYSGAEPEFISVERPNTKIERISVH